MALPLRAPAQQTCSPSSNTAIARQAIVDATRSVIGYELFERSAPSSPGGDGILFDALADACTETLAGRKTVFVRCSLEHMADGNLDLLDPEKVVLEVPSLTNRSPVEADADRSLLMRVCESGFRLAFDSSVMQPRFASWLPLASFIQIDLANLALEDAEQMARQVQAQCKADIVARQVESAQQYDCMMSAGVRFFQGTWFAEPAPVHNTTVPAAQASVLQLLNLVRREADVSEIEELLKKEPTLSFSLLRMINSCGFGLSVEITSFRHAVMILGLNKLFRWATLLMTSSNLQGVAPAAGTLAVVRGRLMELLAGELLPQEDCDNAFLVGVFSLLHTLLGMPLSKALASVNLPSQVVNALLHNEGALAPFLALTVACEIGDEAAFSRAADALQLSNHQVNWAHLQALVWADQVQG